MLTFTTRRVVGGMLSLLRPRRPVLGSPLRPLVCGIHTRFVHGKAGKGSPPGPKAAHPEGSTGKSKVSEWEMLRGLSKHIWPSGSDSFGHKARVVSAVGLLVGAKIVTIQV